MKILSKLDGADQLKQDSNNRFVTDEQIANWNSKGVVNIGAFDNEAELIAYAVMNQLPTGHYTFFINNFPYFMLLYKWGTNYNGIFQDNYAQFYYFEVSIDGTIKELKTIDFKGLDGLRGVGDVRAYIDSQNALKADKAYVDNKVKTDVPLNAKFTDTVTTINGKTGAISKADIVALGIPGDVGPIVNLGTFYDTTELITHVVTNQLATGYYTFVTEDIDIAFPNFMLLSRMGDMFGGAVYTGDAKVFIFAATEDTVEATDTIDLLGLADKADKTYVDSQDALKADKTYVDNKVKTDVPENAVFTDTHLVESVNNKTGEVVLKGTDIEIGSSSLSFSSNVKIDYAIKRLGEQITDNKDKKADKTYVDSQDALKADKSYVDNKVQTDVPSGAKFTDTTYSEITTAEIDTGTASTLRTISGRRVKYIFDKVSSMISVAIGALTKSSVGLGNVDNTSDASKPISTATQTALNGKVNNSQVLTNVPSGAKFTDTITTINGKTGAISKADITALGIPAQDTVYSHPTTHPASMITESSTKRFVSDSEKATWNSKGVIDVGTFANQEALIMYAIMNQVPTGQYSFIMNGYPFLMLLKDNGTSYTGVFFNSEGNYISFNVLKNGEIVSMDTLELNEVNNHLLSMLGSIDTVLTNSSQLMPIRGGVLENYREKLTTVSASGGSINLSIGNVFQHTPSGNRTYAITNAVSGQAHSFTLIINMGSTVRTLTFPASVKWQGGEIPDMSTANKTYILTFMTINGGTTWLGMFGGEF